MYYMATGFNSLDDDLHTAVVNYMISSDNKPWFPAFMALDDKATQKCYNEIVETITDSAVELCNKVQDTIEENWDRIAYC